MVTSPDTERGPLPRLPLLYRLGDLVARRPLRTLTAWLLVLAVSLVLAASLGGEPRDEFTVEGAPSQIGSDLLASAFPVMSGADARVVVHADSGQRVDGRVLAEVGRSLADLPHVGVVDPPRLSPDADTALFSVQYEVPVTDFEGDEGLTALEAASAAATEAGLQVEYGGQVPEMATEISGTAEVVGFGVALLVLLLAFSSFVAAGLPC
jgi:RND superfamily putative drug exporter